jgi:hypothetical protein
MFWAIPCSSSGGQNCIFTASGIVTLCEQPYSSPVYIQYTYRLLVSRYVYSIVTEADCKAFWPAHVCICHSSLSCAAAICYRLYVSDLDFMLFVCEAWVLTRSLGFKYLSSCFFPYVFAPSYLGASTLVKRRRVCCIHALASHERQRSPTSAELEVFGRMQECVEDTWGSLISRHVAVVRHVHVLSRGSMGLINQPAHGTSDSCVSIDSIVPDASSYVVCVI